MTIAQEAAEAAVLRGKSYRVEMMTWLATGEGAEGDPGPFLPLHLQRLALFLPLSLLSGGALGLVMGAVMVNSMDFFVASYALASSGVPAALAWFLWALCRAPPSSSSSSSPRNPWCAGFGARGPRRPRAAPDSCGPPPASSSPIAP